MRCGPNLIKLVIMRSVISSAFTEYDANMMGYLRRETLKNTYYVGCEADLMGLFAVGSVIGSAYVESGANIMRLFSA